MSGFTELNKIVSNPELFEKIYEAKKIYISIFSSIANALDQDEIKNKHHPYKGIKISKGNELQHCPYQVLDIIRDFDTEKGLNIRVLNWWGRGVFIFVIFGGKNDRILNENVLMEFIKNEGYAVSATPSSWDYQKIIDEQQYYHLENGLFSFGEHLMKFKHIQILKKIQYDGPETLISNIKKEITSIFNKLLV